MQIEEYQKAVLEMLNDVDIKSHSDLSDLSSYFAAHTINFLFMLNEGHPVEGMPEDPQYDERMSKLAKFQYALAVDAVDFDTDSLRDCIAAIQSRLARKAMIGTVDRFDCLKLMIGMVTGFSVGIFMAAISDDVENEERWQKVGQMLFKDIQLRIEQEIAKHIPSVGENN